MAKKPVDKLQATNIDSLKEEMLKKYGEGAIMSIADGPIGNVYAVPTMIASLDNALGIFGIPEGRIIELYGAESSGKTTTCLEIIAAFQKHEFKHKGRFGKVAFIDAEHALDTNWANNIGVNVNDMLISQPDSGDTALRICEDLTNSGLIDLIVIDSVAALTPKEEIEGELNDSSIGAQARLMSKALRRLVGVVNTTKTTVIFINQIREKIGVMFGNPETTPGGRALRFYTSIRMQISKGSPVKDGDKVIGFEPKVKIVKNKVAAPFREATYRICAGIDGYPYGIDKAASLVDVAAHADIVNRKSSSYSYNGTILGNGLSNASRFVRNNPEVFQQIYNEVKGRYKKAANVAFDTTVNDDTYSDDNPSFDDDEDA